MKFRKGKTLYSFRSPMPPPTKCHWRRGREAQPEADTIQEGMDEYTKWVSDTNDLDEWRVSQVTQSMEE